jgi:RNA polymerase sigma-70 factor (ECF subfamily)
MADHSMTQPDGAVDDASLVAGAMAGHRRAFEQLYERHKGPIYRTALAVTRDRQAAEELLQEAFLRAYRHLERITLEPGASVRPWLHRIVINLAYDWVARRNRGGAPIEGILERLTTASSLSPERQTEKHEIARVIDEAVFSLPFKHRIVVILYYLHDMDLSEIATLLNLPEGTVKSRLYYGRAKLRSALEADSRLGVARHAAYASIQPPVAG